MHNWLIENIPMDKTVLRKFLRVGVVKDGELFETNKSISFASSLYSMGGVNYSNGSMVRFADDIVTVPKDCY